MPTRTSMSSKLFLVVTLLMFCTLITQSSGSVLFSASEEKLSVKALEKQTAALEEKMTQIQKTMYRLISTLLDDKSDAEVGKDHAVEERDLSHHGNATKEFEYSDEILRLPIHALSGLRGPPGRDGKDGRHGVAGPPGEVGDVYTRWGRTTCGDNSTRIYEGYVVGSPYNTPGGGVNYQCMPFSLVGYSDRNSSENSEMQCNPNDAVSYITGAEYKSFQFGIIPSGANDHRVPCARCYTNDRAAVMMLPGYTICPKNWTKEYEGFLMAGYYNHNHQTTFECMDAKPEYLINEESRTDGWLFYFVRPSCGEGGFIVKREITCAVCSK